MFSSDACVIGKVFLDPTAGVPGAVTCQLGTSGEWDTVKLVLGAQNSGDDMQPATFLWSGTYPARTTVTLRCKTATSGSIVNWIKITAYEGSSLKVLAI